MRVLCICTGYPPHHVGGYELHCQSAMGHLRAHGHEVRVLTGRLPSGVAVEEEDPQVRRELASFPMVPRRTSPARALWLERHSGRVLERQLAEFRPHVVSWWHLGELSQSLVERVRRAGVPAVGLVCDRWMVVGPERDPWMRGWGRHPGLARAWERLTGMATRPRYAGAGAWLFVSEALRRHLVAAGVSVGDDAVARAGIDLPLLPPRRARRWGGRLLYAGRMSRLKGVDTAVRALSELPEETSLRLVGGGDPAYMAELRALADELGVSHRLTLEPARPHAEMADLYTAADAVLFPVRWEEPWGLVPLESMACGTPVVATGTGGSAEYLRHEGNSLLVAPDRPAELARAVRRLAAQPDLRERLAAQGLRTAQEHPAERGHAIVRARLESAAAGAPSVSARTAGAG